MGATTDGRVAFSTRLGRFPTLGVSWVWLHVSVSGESFGFASEELTSDAGIVDGRVASAVYDVADGAVLGCWARRGPPEEPRSMTVALVVPGHRGEDVPDGPGPISLSVTAHLEPESPTLATLAGRTEVVGRVTGTLTTGDLRTSFDGLGHFHEQVQDGERFTTPFTYASLWGEGAGIIAIQTPNRDLGQVWWDGSLSTLRSATFHPSFPELPIRLVEVTTDERTIEGPFELVALNTHNLRQRLWTGSFVKGMLNSRPMVGAINRFDPEAQRPG
jgi:hypothetical protein